MSRFFLASYLVFWLICGASFAYDDDLYIVDDIQIHSSGDSPNDAKNKAFDNSRRRGLEELFVRMRLDPSILDDISNEDLEETVKSEQVKSEVIAGNNYSALFKITYDQHYIRYLLKKKRLEATELEENYLVLPITRVGDKSLVWESDNIWRVAISQSIDDKFLEAQNKKFLVVSGDVENKSTISSYAVNQRDFKRFEPTILRYNANGIYLISFFNDVTNQKVVVDIDLIKRNQKKNIKLSFINTASINQNHLMSKVANKTIDYLLSVDGKEIRNHDSAVKDVIVRTGSYERWLKVKQKIQDSRIISDFTIKTISTEWAVISLKYSGQNIIQDFQNIGLDFEQIGDNIFQIN
ncbi:MAG: DUF2066 domain-containing protein [Rickettsiales bacterium]|nr:DUF2066 domain-containing protein [Rickettsiales bacterium]